MLTNHIFILSAACHKQVYIPKVRICLKYVLLDTLCATSKELFLILFAAPDDDAGTVALSTIST